MQRSNRLEAIQESKFLSLQSNASIDTSTELYDTEQRPFAIPQYDPQGSIYTSRYSKELASTLHSSEYSDDAFEKTNYLMRYDSKIPMEPLKTHPRLPTSSPHCKFEDAGLARTPTSPPPYMSPRPRHPRHSTTIARRSAMRISRLSITPSIVAPGCLPPDLNYRRNTSTNDIISTEPGKISPMHIVRLPSEKPDFGPPDGGTLAWLMVLAGFFVVMDAQ